MFGSVERIHLRRLERAHPILGREHEHADAALAAHRVLGRRPGVARGRAEDVEVALSPGQRVLEQIAEQLHRDVLERQRRPVRRAQQQHARLQRQQRRDVVAAESRRGIGAIDQRLELGGRDVVGEQRQQREGQPAIAERAERASSGAAEVRIACRHRQTAVGREAFEQDRRERLRRHAAARADVFHRR